MILVYYVMDQRKLIANSVYLDSIFLSPIPVLTHVLMDITLMIRLEDVTDVMLIYAQNVIKLQITVLLVLLEDIWLTDGAKILAP
jgi:hypothetical protein